MLFVYCGSMVKHGLVKVLEKDLAIIRLLKEGYSPSEVAEKFGVDPSVVRARLYYIRDRFRRFKMYVEAIEGEIAGDERVRIFVLSREDRLKAL